MPRTNGRDFQLILFQTGSFAEIVTITTAIALRLFMSTAVENKYTQKMNKREYFKTKKK